MIKSKSEYKRLACLLGLPTSYKESDYEKLEAENNRLKELEKKLAKRIRNQRNMLHDNWVIVEQRRKAGVGTVRGTYVAHLIKRIAMYKDENKRLRDALIDIESNGYALPCIKGIAKAALKQGENK